MSPKKLNILLADDESEIAMLVSSVLRRSGHSVECVEDGETAVARLTEKTGYYDIVITDSNMPGISGIEVIEYLRKQEFRGGVILLSGYVAQESQDVYEALKIDRIIQKPFVFSDLSKAVNELSVEMENVP